MASISKTLEKIKDKYTKTGKIEPEDFNNLRKMVRFSGIKQEDVRNQLYDFIFGLEYGETEDIKFRNEIIDLQTDVYMVQGDYQKAYNTVNDILKNKIGSLAGDNYVLCVKLIYVRMQVFSKDKEIDLGNKVSLEDYETLKKNAEKIISEYEKVKDNLDKYQEFRVDELINKIKEVQKEIDSNEEKNSGGIKFPIFPFGKNKGANRESPTDEIEIPDEEEPDEEEPVVIPNAEEPVVIPDEEEPVVILDEEEPVVIPNEEEPRESVKPELSLEEIDNRLYDLEEDLLFADENSPEYLDKLLQIIDLKYVKLSKLNEKIEEMKRELQKYEDIRTNRSSVLQIIGLSTKMADKIERMQNEINDLEGKRDEMKQSFDEYPKQVNEIIERE